MATIAVRACLNYKYESRVMQPTDWRRHFVVRPRPSREPSVVVLPPVLTLGVTPIMDRTGGRDEGTQICETGWCRPQSPATRPFPFPKNWNRPCSIDPVRRNLVVAEPYTLFCLPADAGNARTLRSEERRVGKEGRAQGA